MNKTKDKRLWVFKTQLNNVCSGISKRLLKNWKKRKEYLNENLEDLLFSKKVIFWRKKVFYISNCLKLYVMKFNKNQYIYLIFQIFLRILK